MLTINPDILKVAAKFKDPIDSNKPLLDKDIIFLMEMDTYDSKGIINTFGGKEYNLAYRKILHDSVVSDLYNHKPDNEV